MRRNLFIASPYDQPRLVREIAIRVLAEDVNNMLGGHHGDGPGAEHPEVLARASRAIYNSIDMPMRERRMASEAMHVAWSVYRRLKELGIIGAEFDKIV